MNEEAQYAQFIRIEQLYEWERLQEAIKETENYIQQYPEDADGYAVLSKVYLKQGTTKRPYIGH
ncbi:Tetratricopeptide repeat protein OS=Lysinibacillus sphaericus OX=1421 GN=LS41612_00525 PE=4 SV=1 [Lysinibacillus sphaericus]